MNNILAKIKIIVFTFQTYKYNNNISDLKFKF